MFVSEPARIEVAADLSLLDQTLEEVASGAGVYLLRAREGDPYLGRTSILRRRLKRLLRQRSSTSKLLNLRSVVQTIEYWTTGSSLESSLLFWELARTSFGDRYLEIVKLRYPSYVKLILSNQFPRTQVTNRLGGGASLYYGPFRARTLAEEFEHQVLDLFQLRRCQEDLQPSPEHPGCIYGEMNMCLRPCQQVVGVAEYASEARRIADFLETNGKHLLQLTAGARDRLSQELDFEGAAREHKRVERIEQVLKTRDDLASEVTHLNGVAVVPSSRSDTVRLMFMLAGNWQEIRDFDTGLHADEGHEPLSMDARLRAIVAAVQDTSQPSPKLRQDHIALLVRWYFSSWRDGEWIPMPDLQKPPFRKLVGAISRTAIKCNR